MPSIVRIPLCKGLGEKEQQHVFEPNVQHATLSSRRYAYVHITHLANPPWKESCLLATKICLRQQREILIKGAKTEKWLRISSHWEEMFNEYFIISHIIEPQHECFYIWEILHWSCVLEVLSMRHRSRVYPEPEFIRTQPLRSIVPEKEPSG